MTGPIPHAAETAILALNNAHATELSLLDAPRLHQLLARAFHARMTGEADAFLMAFDETADYDSVNFLWHRARFARFVYVDRVCVAPLARGGGLARALYGGLFAAARAAARPLILCEVNVEPPNPASDAFHASLGFQEVGAAAIHGGAKTVRYLALNLLP